MPSTTQRGLRSQRRDMGESSTPLPQRARPLLTTVPHGSVSPAARVRPLDPGFRRTLGLSKQSRAGKDAVRASGTRDFAFTDDTGPMHPGNAAFSSGSANRGELVRIGPASARSSGAAVPRPLRLKRRTEVRAAPSKERQHVGVPTPASRPACGDSTSRPSRSISPSRSASRSGSAAGRGSTEDFFVGGRRIRGSPSASASWRPSSPPSPTSARRGKSSSTASASTPDTWPSPSRCSS